MAAGVAARAWKPNSVIAFDAPLVNWSIGFAKEEDKDTELQVVTSVVRTSDALSGAG